jgi:hypothetical protein
MLKKIAFAAVAVVAGLFILNSTHFGSYARTAWHKVKTAAKCQVPLEFQLESARNEIAQLIPDMQKHIDVIAQETIAVRRMKDDITLTRANLAEQKKNLVAVKDELKKGEVKFLYGSRFYSADRVGQKLARDLASCQRCEKELESREKMLEAKETALDAAREQLASMKSEKEKLEVLVAQMEAELKTLRVAQTRSQFHASELTAEFLNDTIPVAQQQSAPSKDQVIKQVEAYLGDDKADSSVAAQK